MELTKDIVEKIADNTRYIKNKIEFMNSIRDSIKYHDDLYYKQAKPTISDYEYDKMVESYNKNLSKFESEVDVMLTTHRLAGLDGVLLEKPAEQALNTEYIAFLVDTLKSKIPFLELKVGSSLEDVYEKKKHIVPMLSLNNSYSSSDIKSFIETSVDVMVKNGIDLSKNSGDLEYVFEDKIDGMSCSITYVDGELSFALTRGDGETGEVITRKVNNLSSVPRVLDTKDSGTVEIRGELIISNHEWMTLKQVSDYKNQRNAAAGIVRSKTDNYDSYLSFVAYDIRRESGTISTHEDKLKTLEQLGFEIPRSYKIDLYDSYCSPVLWGKVQEVIDSLLNAVRENNKTAMSYLIDGAVIKLNKTANYDLLGKTSKFPKWATSFKYKDDVYISNVIGVTWQVGRTGRVTPVAEIEPIEIDGSTVSRATLHNLEQMVRLGNVRAGKTVEVIKSAAVIPKILKVVDHFIDEVCCEDIDYDKIDYPRNCPCCGTVLVIDGPELICPNEVCKDRVIQSLAFYCGRDYMNIEGISDKIITKLYTYGYIRSVQDLYKLKDIRDILIKIPGYGPVIIDKLLANIEKSKSNDVYRFIAGLGYKSVGRTISKLLINRFNDIHNLAKATETDLRNISGIGAKNVKDVMVLITDIPTILTNYIDKFGLNSKSHKVELKNNSLEGKTFVLTGKFLNRTRKEYEHEIKIRGGKTSSSVSFATNYIVVGEDATQHKVIKAMTYGVETIGETTLQDMFEN